LERRIRRQETMTAGMTSQHLERSRVSLPRIGLGALLVATLVTGVLIGAAAYAGIGAALAQPARAAGAHAVSTHRLPAGPGLADSDGDAVAPPGGSATWTFDSDVRLPAGPGLDEPDGPATATGTTARATSFSTRRLPAGPGLDER
jgi:hypothetical protein